MFETIRLEHQHICVLECRYKTSMFFVHILILVGINSVVHCSVLLNQLQALREWSWLEKSTDTTYRSLYIIVVTALPAGQTTCFSHCFARALLDKSVLFNCWMEFAWARRWRVELCVTFDKRVYQLSYSSSQQLLNQVSFHWNLITIRKNVRGKWGKLQTMRSISACVEPLNCFIFVAYVRIYDEVGRVMMMLMLKLLQTACHYDDDSIMIIIFLSYGFTAQS